MLVMTRKVGETIRIGALAEVTVVSIMGQRVRLGITAPKDLHITRPESRKEKDHAEAD